MSQPQHSSGGEMPASLMAILTRVEVFSHKLQHDAAPSGLSNSNSNNSSSRTPPRFAELREDEEDEEEDGHGNVLLRDVLGENTAKPSSKNHHEKKGVDNGGKEHHRTTSTCLIPSVDHFASLLPGESEEEEEDGDEGASPSPTNQTKQVAIEVYTLLHELYKEVQTVYKEDSQTPAVVPSPTSGRLLASSTPTAQQPAAPVVLLPAPPPGPFAPAPPAPLEPWMMTENNPRSSTQNEKQQQPSPNLPQRPPRVPASVTATPTNASGRTIRFRSSSNKSETPLSSATLSTTSTPKILHLPLVIPPSPGSSRCSSVDDEHLTFVFNTSQQEIRPFAPCEESQAEHGVDAEGFDTLNNYAILQELGRGNFGKVMLACDLEGNQVAIKSMSCGVKAPKHRFARIASTRFQHRGSLFSQTSRSNTTRSSSLSSERDLSSGSSGRSLRENSEHDPLFSVTPAETMVMREVAIMKKLRHKNIVQLREVIHDEEDDQTHLVMDYICNGALAEVSSTGVCTSNILTIGDLDACKDYIRQAAKGLEYLHRQGIVHRDVKPENLLVGSEKDCYIADFGVSAVLHHNKMVDVTAGTQTFFSPEILRGDYEEASRYGEQSDVWALGVTLYAIVFGKLPFFATNIMALSHSVLHDPVTFPEDPDSPCAHHPLQHVFEGVLHKNPSQRWTLAKFRHALRARNTHSLTHRLRSKVDRAAAHGASDTHTLGGNTHPRHTPSPPLAVLGVGANLLLGKQKGGDAFDEDGEDTDSVSSSLVGFPLRSDADPDISTSSMASLPSSDGLSETRVVVTEEEVQQAIISKRVSFFRTTVARVAKATRFDGFTLEKSNCEYTTEYSDGDGI